MGSQSSSMQLKQIIINDDVEELDIFINRLKNDKNMCLRGYLNREGDSLLIYAARLHKIKVVNYLLRHNICDINATNHLNDTALDTLLSADLPADVVTRYFGLPVTSSCKRFVPPKQPLGTLTKTLLQHGAYGLQLLRFIMCYMDNEGILKSFIKDYTCLNEAFARQTTALLLQVIVFYQHRRLLLLLLRKGVPIELFWDIPFMPGLSPCNATPGVSEGDMEYTLPEVLDKEETHCYEKLALVQAWRDEWNNGDYSEAQYRADCSLDPDSAVIFLQAANNSTSVQRVMEYSSKYLPQLCGGPDLHNHQLYSIAMRAGYDIIPQNNQSIKTTPSLKELSRRKLRKCFKTNIFHSVQFLDIPKTLKQYLLLQHSS